MNIVFAGLFWALLAVAVFSMKDGDDPSPIFIAAALFAIAWQLSNV